MVKFNEEEIKFCTITNRDCCLKLVNEEQDKVLWSQEFNGYYYQCATEKYEPNTLAKLDPNDIEYPPHMS